MILSYSGHIKFLDPVHGESSATADLMRHTASSLTMKVVMEGRTDVFYVNLKTLKGYQKLLHSDGAETQFPLKCSR